MGRGEGGGGLGVRGGWLGFIQYAMLDLEKLKENLYYAKANNNFSCPSNVKMTHFEETG